MTAPVTEAVDGRQRKRQKVLKSEAILAVREAVKIVYPASSGLGALHCTAAAHVECLPALLQAGRAVKPVGTQLPKPSKAAQGAKHKGKGRTQQQPQKQQPQAGIEAATLDIWGPQTQEPSAGAEHICLTP